MAIGQAGLQPFRHWQVWAALVLASLVLLWAIETIAGNLIWNEEVSASRTAYILWVAVPLMPLMAAGLFYRHIYLKALRPYIARVSFEKGVNWLAAIKGLLTGLASVPLAICFMFLIDWTINSFDESQDPRIAALKNWPTPVLDAENGFIAAVGIEAPAGTDPFEAGRQWLARADEIVLSHSKEDPMPPQGLKFTEYSVKDESVKPAPRTSGGIFCKPGTKSCLDIVSHQRTEIEAWLAKNRELLARYQSLYRYPQWQYTITPGMAILPRYSGLMQGQSLLHASALAALNRGQTDKAVDMLESDFRFARKMMGAKDALIGKMIASALFLRDLAVLSDVIAQRPHDLAPHWARIEKMLNPLTLDEVSLADTFRFEGKWGLGHIEKLSFNPEPGLNDNPIFATAWAQHHFKLNAMKRLQLDFTDRLVASVELKDPSYTPAFAGESGNFGQDISRITGFMHNQMGTIASLSGSANYFWYANKAIDLNALNNLVHLQAVLARNRIPAQDVPAFLAASNKVLWNPETGKPFEWDAKSREIYFVPATESWRKDFHLSGSTPGRIGITTAEGAMVSKPRTILQPGNT